MKKLIVFHATWCGPCKAYDPIVSKFKESHPEIEVKSYDVDSEDEEVRSLLSKHNVRSVPTTIAEVDGVITKKFGLITADELEKLMQII